MQNSASLKTEDVPFGLSKANSKRPTFAPRGAKVVVTDAVSVSGINGRIHHFADGYEIDFEHKCAVPGSDFEIVLTDTGRLISTAWGLGEGVRIGGFHYALGGNASARAGGDDKPAINPFTCWDRNYRPACPDPRGMALIDGAFWCDIYLTGADHIEHGTSMAGVTIADGDDLPQKPGGERFRRCDYETAVAIASHHGKRLLSFEEFAWATIGVTERSAASGEPKLTGLDAARTSRHGIMQATGNMWVWGTDGDPDEPRASLLGGCWLGESNAGSRYAHVAYNWPEVSGNGFGVRACSDHLTTV